MIMKRFLVSVALALSLVAPVFVAQDASAALFSGSTDQACQGVGLGGNGCKGGTTKINSTIRNIVDILSLVVGIIAVIMIIVSGIKYVTSQGEASGTKAAKDTLVYAIVGLIVVALAQFLVKFVLEQIL